ncbi:hypothetical protein AB0F72_26350 [Actinoplanes sp. NPDC023936]|uniref:hypothetical protein n=1 Tax=Actinoplanes sp. NPDC023936 TaxID=3154910 RepID=UPI0033D733D9
MKRILALVVAACLPIGAAGCGGEPSAVVPPDTAVSSAPPVLEIPPLAEAPSTPLSVPPEPTRSRVPADCGTFVLKQGEALPAGAAGCLLDAAGAKRVATLRVTAPTVEGHPIPTTYAARADGRIDVTVDSRTDPYGEQAMTRRTCATADYDTARGIVVGDCANPLRVEE